MPLATFYNCFVHEDSEELGQNNHEENIFVLFYEFQKMIYDQKKKYFPVKPI